VGGIRNSQFAIRNHCHTSNIRHRVDLPTGSDTITDMPTVLHVLSQRPSLTGSGITLDALVRNAEAAGWNQHVIVGVPADDPTPDVGNLPPSRIHPLRFGADALERFTWGAVFNRVEAVWRELLDT